MTVRHRRSLAPTPHVLTTVLFAIAVLAGSLLLVRDAHAQLFEPYRSLDALAGASTESNHSSKVAMDRAGRAVAIWRAPDPLGGVQVTRSTDSGKTWSAAATISEPNGFKPAVATDGAGTWVAAWSGYGIAVARSTDGGVTWSAPVTLVLDDPEYFSPSQNVNVAADGHGTWIVSWQGRDTDDGDDDVFFARSADGGATWSAPALLDLEGASDLDLDEFPHLAANGAGTWVAVWNSISNPAWVILTARSTDDGVTWSAPTMLDVGAGSDTYARQPRIAVDDDGTWVAGWASWIFVPGHFYADVLVARSTDAGVTWSPPVTLIAGTDAHYVGASAPDLATDGKDTWLAVWMSEDSLGGGLGGDHRDVLGAWSTDRGTTWSAPSALNGSAARDGQYEWDPHVASDGAGGWLAVWDTYDGNLEGPWDVAVARAEQPCSVTPLPACQGPSASGKGSLRMETPARAAKRRIRWTGLRNGGATKADFGNPVATDDYAFCIYDAGRLVSASVVKAGGTCAGKPCWKETAGGFSYRHREPGRSGVERLDLRAGDAALRLEARGPSVWLPAPDAPLVGPVRAQLVRVDGGLCWEETYGSPFQRNEPGRFAGR